jgi:hypothetical protein
MGNQILEARRVTEYTPKPGERNSDSFRAGISQGGLDFWLEQAIGFLPGDPPCFLIVPVSLSKSKRGPQAHGQRICWRPHVARAFVLSVASIGCFLTAEELDR